MAIFPLRDPVTRFVSGFYSRLRRGRTAVLHPAHEAERKAFEWFPTPQELADALAERRAEAMARESSRCSRSLI